MVRAPLERAAIARRSAEHRRPDGGRSMIRTPAGRGKCCLLTVAEGTCLLGLEASWNEASDRLEDRQDRAGVGGTIRFDLPADLFRFKLG